MPIRDILLSIVLVGLLPICLTQPWKGILVWSWLGYMNPHKLCWGFMRFMPVAQVVAITVLLGTVSAKDKERRSIPLSRETLMLLALWADYVFTTLFAFYPDEAWPQLIKVSKILLFIFLTLMFFQTRDRLRPLFMVLALSIGFYGIKGGIWVFRTGALGTSHVLGPEGTFIGGNNEIGLALDMTLPFLLILAREEKRRWLRRLMLTAFGFSIVAIMFTYSRGAILGLPVVLAMLFLRSKKRFIGIFAIIILGYFVMLFPPEEWFNRLHSIGEYQKDGSAMMRLESWYVAWQFALDYPLTGGGFWVLPHDVIFDRYLTTYIRSQSAHNIYLTVLADHGFPGFFLFVGLMISSFLSLWRLRRAGLSHPDGAWLVNYCQILEVSLAAFAVSGMFLSQSYWDLFYHIVSFVILLQVIAVREGVVTARQRVAINAQGVLAPVTNVGPVHSR